MTSWKDSSNVTRQESKKKKLKFWRCSLCTCFMSYSNSVTNKPMHACSLILKRNLRAVLWVQGLISNPSKWRTSRPIITFLRKLRDV